MKEKEAESPPHQILANFQRPRHYASMQDDRLKKNLLRSFANIMESQFCISQLHFENLGTKIEYNEDLGDVFYLMVHI